MTGRKTYAERKKVSDRHLVEAKAILLAVLGRYIFGIETASEKMDKEEATDIVMSGLCETGTIPICFRCKSGRYNHMTDFNIRMSVQSGARTELHKLREGYGKFYFFCWLDKMDRQIEKWMIIDLDIVRRHDLFSRLIEKKVLGGDCTFGILKFDTLNQYGAILATSWGIQKKLW